MDRCVGCPAVDLPWCAAESHRRYCDLTDNPAYRKNIVLRSEAGPLILVGIVESVAIPLGDATPSIVLIGWPPCRHRSHRWNCNAEMTAACAIGLGQAGIIDEQDCRGCAQADPAPA